MARKHVVAFGGDGFSDEFANQLAPYFYSGGESATRVETAFAQWWCNQMSSVNVPSRKVKYAKTNNPSQNFNGQARRLGVISTNDPDNEDTVNKVLTNALAKCGDKIWHTYFYDQNINTAAQQVAAGIAAMDTPQNPANVVLCLCDPVAPAFLYQGEQGNNYYPENVIATDQTMDFDWSKYRVSVRRVEKLTGYRFFPAVPAEVAAALKGRVDEVEVRVPRPRAGGGGRQGKRD